MTAVTTGKPQSLIRWRYLYWSLGAIATMLAAIVADNVWFLDFVHVLTALLWTGIDLFMGFVLGPILRRVDLPVRREVVRRLTPRTMFLMRDFFLLGAAGSAALCGSGRRLSHTVARARTREPRGSVGCALLSVSIAKPAAAL